MRACAKVELSSRSPPVLRTPLGSAEPATAGNAGRGPPVEPRARRRPPSAGSTTTVAPAIPTVVLAPNVLSVRHWGRLLGGTLYAATVRVDWATLLRRTFDVDVLRCPGCGGRLRVLGEITDAAIVRLVLESLQLPTDAPRAARARDPTELLGDESQD